MTNAIKKWLPFKRHAKLPVKAMGSEQVQPLARLNRDINQLFQQFWNDPFGALQQPWGGLDGWFGDHSPAAFAPSVDIADEPEHLRITAELPGIEKDDINLEVREDCLVLRGEKKLEETSQEDGYYRCERSFGAFERQVPLPVEVDVDHADARFKKGVLTVRLPKAKPASAPRKVDINVN